MSEWGGNTPELVFVYLSVHFEACGKHIIGDAVGHRLKEANDKAPAEFKAYTDCMDYYRCGLGVLWQDCIYVLPRFHALTVSLLCLARSNKFTKCRKEQEAFEKAFSISIAAGSPA